VYNPKILWYLCQKYFMGRKKIEPMSAEAGFALVSRMLVPEYILRDFEIFDAIESADRWVIYMREREGRVPVALQSFDDVVLDGYCDPIEILSHSYVCKPIYLCCYRRRYKRSCTDRHYSNEYDLTLKGVKMVKELGFFLKEEDRRLPD
jgi:hypothetical protein